MRLSLIITSDGEHTEVLVFRGECVQVNMVDCTIFKGTLEDAMVTQVSDWLDDHGYFG